VKEVTKEPVSIVSRDTQSTGFDPKYARNAATAASVLFDKKWKVHLLCAMRSGSVRLGQLGRLIPVASKKVLTQHLRQLEADGLITRTDKSDLVLHVEYALVKHSREDLLALLDHLAEWGTHYVGTPIDAISSLKTKDREQSRRSP
jgi:DNA-binding HxlR family transcriptional regulator